MLTLRTLSKDYQHISEHYAYHHQETFRALNDVLKKYEVEIQ